MNQSLLLKWILPVLGLIGLFNLTACLPDNTPDLPTLLETLEADARYDGYLDFSNASGGTENLDGSLFYTLFVPDNAAIDSFKARKGISDFSELPDSTLKQIMWYHRQLGKVSTQEMNGGYFTSPASSYLQAPISILFDISSGDVEINRIARLTRTNLEASDGMIHEMDEMLIPPTVYDLLEKNGDFDIFLDAAERGGMTDFLKESVGFTLFAAPDQIWQNYFDDAPGVEDLDDFSNNELKNIIQYHILSKFHTSASFQNLSFPTEFPTELAGNKIKIFDNLSSVVLNDSISVLLFDIQGVNGSIHFIDDVLTTE